jgi:energy-coupling factor transporter ATP-binding protein EcfA2
MKIGLIGAPGSGKSKLARALAKTSPYTVVDNYVDRLRKQDGLAYGGFGNYMDNIQVAFKRRELETKAAHSGANTITCGTIVDTNVYAFLWTDLVTTDRNLIPLEHQRVETAMKTFGMLYAHLFDYDFAFYLPYVGEEAFSRKIDQVILTTFEAYWTPAVFLLNDNITGRLEEITRVINGSPQVVPPTTDGSGIQPGRENGGTVGDSPGSVSDVSVQT